MKKILGLMIIMFLCCINCTSADGLIENNEEDMIVTSFGATEAEFLEVSINASDKIIDSFLDMHELEKYNSDIFNKLDIVGKQDDENNRLELEETYHTETIDNDEQKQILTYGKDKNGNYITLIISTYKNKDEEETSLCIDINTQNIDEMKQYNDKIMEIFLQFETQPLITTCITGTYTGELNMSRRYKTVFKALNSINAEAVEGLNDDSLISVSAYSPQIKNYIFSGNKKMNLNVAMRYSEYEDKTYIWMATPLITTGY
ncbi:YwmB family TATA-box binding protein [Abyssisolibacter fermentans]|uniref:YwmB family TATA-box binding protein n=1 Tax=Abyssisolibacter fermentans TaxID=1766203 RepID=UPI0008327E1F|nr:YwmB family TATA-box binding protein [Abyssisolibacter fermentans]